MADLYKIRKGNLPTWHSEYVEGSSDPCNPFLKATAEVQQGGIKSTNYLSTSKSYLPNHLVKPDADTSVYTAFWKTDTTYFNSKQPYKFVYAGTVIGLSATANTYNFTGPTADQGGTKRYDFTYTASDRVLQISGAASQTIRDIGPAVYFEIQAAGGGGSAAYDRGMSYSDGNGGGGGSFVACVFDFTQQSSFSVFLGAPGKGGRTDGNATTARGKNGEDSEISVAAAYNTLIVGAGGGGPPQPDGTIPVDAPQPGRVYESNARTGLRTQLTSFPRSFGRGLYILYGCSGGFGGINANARASGNGNVKDTSLPAGTCTFLPGESAKTFTATTGGINATGQYPLNNHGGGGASRISNAIWDRYASNALSTPKGCGGVGGCTNAGSSGTNSTEGRQAANGGVAQLSVYRPEYSGAVHSPNEVFIPGPYRVN